MNKSNLNMVNIADYMNNYCSSDVKDRNQKRIAFYFLDKKLKEKHSNGEFLSKYSYNSFMICVDDPTIVEISSLRNELPENYDNHRRNDLLYLNLIAFNAYLPNVLITYLLTYKVVVDNFDSLSYIFDHNDFDYYNDVFKNNNINYYSDFIDKLNKKKNGGNTCNSRSLIYSTPEGRAMTDSELGFTSFLLLVVNITSICLIFGLLLMYLIKIS